MRTIQVKSGFYKIKMGEREYKVYASDLKMISKRRKGRSLPLPYYTDADEF